MAWLGLIRPPQLQHSDTDAGTQRTATWLELFFDLAFLLVVELAVGLRNDLTPHGVLVFAGLFSSVWWAWAGFTRRPRGFRPINTTPVVGLLRRSTTVKIMEDALDDLGLGKATDTRG